MARNTVAIRIVVGGARQARRAFGGLTDGLAKFGLAMQGVQSALSAFTGVAELAKLGAMSERVERRFGAFAEEAGGATAILEAFQKGAGGTVDKMGAMSTASRLLQMGLVGSAGEMENVVEIATRLGDQTQGATDRIADFSLLLANQSIPRLDNFGISSGKVRARIQELQDATPGLSREIAFMTATMEQAELSLTKLGPRVDDDAAKFERLEAQISDTKVEIGQQLAPVVAELFGLFSDLLTAITPLIGILGSMKGGTIAAAGGFAALSVSATNLAGGLGPLATKLGTTQKGLGAVTLAVGAWIIAFNEAQKLLDEVNRGMEESQEVIASWTTTATAMVDEGGSLADVLVTMSDRVNETQKAFEQGGVVADIFVDQSKLMKDASSEVNDIILENVGTFDEYTNAIEQFNSSVTDSNAKITSQSDMQKRANQIFEMGTGSITEFEAQQKALAESTVALTLVEFELATGTGAAAHEMERLGILEQNAAAATAELNEETEKIVISQEMAELALLNAGRAAEKYEVALAEQAKAQEELAAASIVEEQQLAARALSNANAAAREFEAALQAQTAASEASVVAAEAAATALAAQIEQTNAAAVSQTNLAASLLDATEAQIAQALISQLDPEALGAEAFSAAVTDIQLAFGLADEKSVALAANLGGLADAINQGIVPAEQAAQALETMIFATERGVAESDSLIQSIEGLAPPIEIATQRTADMTVEIAALGTTTEEVDGLLSIAAGSALDFGSNASTATGDVQGMTTAAGDLADELFALTSAPHVISVQIETTGALPGPGGGFPQMQGGGIVPGPIGAPIPILAHGGETVLPVGGSTNNFLTINTTQAPSIPLEFQTMSAFASA